MDIPDPHFPADGRPLQIIRELAVGACVLPSQAKPPCAPRAARKGLLLWGKIPLMR